MRVAPEVYIERNGWMNAARERWPTSSIQLRLDEAKLRVVGKTHGYALAYDPRSRAPMPYSMLIELGYLDAAETLYPLKGPHVGTRKPVPRRAGRSQSQPGRSV